MLKPLSLSLGLAVALSTCGLSRAGLLDHASPQCESPSPQGVYATAQSGCGDVCAPAKKHKLCDLFKKREKCYTYEWVLKKKRVWGHHKNTGCGEPTCNTCSEGVYASGQGVYPAAQGAYPAAQSWGAPQAYGAGQMTAPAAPAAEVMEEAPPAPPAEEPQANAGGLLFLSPAGN